MTVINQGCEAESSEKIKMQKMMQSDEYDGSGLSLFSNPDYEVISDNVQHWDEDVVDLEFRPGIYESVSK